MNHLWCLSLVQPWLDVTHHTTGEEDHLSYPLFAAWGKQWEGGGSRPLSLMSVKWWVYVRLPHATLFTFCHVIHQLRACLPWRFIFFLSSRAHVTGKQKNAQLNLARLRSEKLQVRQDATSPSRLGKLLGWWNFSCQGITVPNTDLRKFVCTW